VVGITHEVRTVGAKSTPFTRVALEVRAVISGKPPLPLVPTLLGGPIDGTELVTVSVPRFAVGDEDILFIADNGRSIFPLYGMMHGRYPVRRDASSRNVLIRAIGPGLTQFGVGAVLADPTMTLNRIAGGVASVIATNDDWAASLATTFTAAGAFPLSVGSKDAAIQVHLLPGSYTITVGGKAGNSGQVLVELYEIR